MSRIRERLALLRNVAREMPPRYVLFRASYEFRRRTGLLRRAFPSAFRKVPPLTLAAWRGQERGKFFLTAREALALPRHPTEALRTAAEHVLAGDVLFFGARWMPAAKLAGWTVHPETGYDFGTAKHWTQYESLDPAAGDIKFVWERARFSHVLSVMRYDWHFGEDHSAFVIGEILDFIRKNPLNHGPNYVCSQEISVRLMNWFLVLHFYRNCTALTEEVFAEIWRSIYGQLKHVRANIHFSRIAVRNNHAVTECAMLYVAGLLFPELREAAGWRRDGLRWLTQEIEWQVFADGMHIQYSTNYERVVLQVLTYVFALAQVQGQSLPPVLRERFQAAITFLFRLQDGKSGWLPNYGANDGALFFPLADADVRDYRPALDAAWHFATGENLYGEAFEERGWFGAVDRGLPASLQQRDGLFVFPEGGATVLRDGDSVTFMPCAAYRKSRPSHADGLHLDLWVGGKNVLFDGGSYLYNTSEGESRYFMGTESHNTVMLGEADQMRKGPRFLWFDWIRIADMAQEETETEWILSGAIHAFASMGPNIVIRREVRKTKGECRWRVTDAVEGVRSDILLRQLWHFREGSPVRFQSSGRERRKAAWVSDYYGVKDPAEQVEFQSAVPRMETAIWVDP